MAPAPLGGAMLGYRARRAQEDDDVSPLDLESPRWAELETHFGDGGEVPLAIERWLGARGRDLERDEYGELFELFLHQLSITSCAYAVVPWLVHGLAESAPELALEITPASTIRGDSRSRRPRSNPTTSGPLDTARTKQL
ncbi:hypothetical protein DB32_005489 [Sandaracinus amylolyticus]|uniref:Uncharacterized protein n=1 Tax=Sandaracinus amylolyticus TaxID=927083 RepID=A0A0F6W685_9BACT|nr:hypothetical protein DB32_005489 [Sandaracinus amylolyticus]